MIHVFYDTETSDQWGKPNLVELSVQELHNVPESESHRLSFVRSEDEEALLDHDVSIGIDNV